MLGAGTAGLQTPLNVRLLRQLGTRAGKTVSVISGDPYIQELSRVGGLATYASVPAFERGHPDGAPARRRGPAGHGAAGSAAAAGDRAARGPAPAAAADRERHGGAAARRGGTRLAGRRRAPVLRRRRAW